MSSIVYFFFRPQRSSRRWPSRTGCCMWPTGSPPHSRSERRGCPTSCRGSGSSTSPTLSRMTASSGASRRFAGRSTSNTLSLKRHLGKECWGLRGAAFFLDLRDLLFSPSARGGITNPIISAAHTLCLPPPEMKTYACKVDDSTPP